jgi:hypothetical protein
MDSQELTSICRVGYVTEILSKDRFEVTFDTEEGIEKVVYIIPGHCLIEGIKIKEQIYLSRLNY